MEGWGGLTAPPVGACFRLVALFKLDWILWAVTPSPSARLNTPHPPRRVQGGDLRNALTADRADELGWYRAGKGIALDILRGLTFLHDSHVIHRDIKSKVGGATGLAGSWQGCDGRGPAAGCCCALHDVPGLQQGTAWLRGWGYRQRAHQRTPS